MTRILAVVSLFYIALGAAVFALWPTQARPEDVTYSYARGEKVAPDTYSWASGYSVIKLVPVEGKDHIAEVRFLNAPVHNNAQVTDTLTIRGLTISFSADVGQGYRPDFLDVETPEGFIAVPPSISVEESSTGVILIYEAKGREAM